MEDEDAFARLYERESEAVLLFLTRRTFDVEVAVELTAETFALALRSWRRVRALAPEQARAWLFTVARRLNGRYLRRSRVEQRAVRRLGIQTPTIHEDDIHLIEARAGLTQLRGVLHQELGRLSDGQRRASTTRTHSRFTERPSS